MTKNEPIIKTTERSYPKVYEKLIPVAIGVIVLLIIGMLALAVAIATGGIPSG